MRLVLAVRRPGKAEGPQPKKTSVPDTESRQWVTRWLEPGKRDAILARIVASRKDSTTRLEPEDRDLRGIQLVGQDLSGLDLSGVDFSMANLSQTDLSGSRLTGAKFRGANLYGANLTEAEFLQADLCEADLSECSAGRAGFGSADLSGANLFNTDFTAATFTQSKLCNADARAATFCRARLLDADLSGADFNRCVMGETDFANSGVTGASFLEADLRQARLYGLHGHDDANWIGADINGVDFCGAYLVRRTIEDQNYLHEFRTQNRMSRFFYWAWWVTSDCGRSFVRWGLWTLLIVVLFAGIYEHVAIDYGDYPTPFSSLYYSVVTLTTLGYGDVLPASTTAQLIAMGQVTIGYVMLGGLLSIFSNKMARRAS